MTIANTSLLLDFSIPLFRDSRPLQIIKSASGRAAKVQEFSNLTAWRQHVLNLSPRGRLPDNLRHKYNQTLQLLFMAWLNESVVKLAELGALTVLEGTVKARYKMKFRGLRPALEHLVNDTSCNISTDTISALSEIRNRLAHGDPFEATPWGDLFETVRDLIDLMYPVSSE